jgi:hypothetical protein
VKASCTQKLWEQWEHAASLYPCGFPLFPQLFYLWEQWEQTESAKSCGLNCWRPCIFPSVVISYHHTKRRQLECALKVRPCRVDKALCFTYAHEIAHSAAALHYGGLFVPTVPTRGGTCGNTESLVPQGMPHVPTVPTEKHGEVK